jgi:D-lactate dehydrogenase
MRVAIFSLKPYDRLFLQAANAGLGHDLVFLEQRLARETTALAADFPAVCVFVNDCVDAEVLEQLAAQGTRLVALRCAGFNNVDLEAARRYQMTVARVPAYSPYAVAEHAVGLMLTLNRKFHRSYNRVREGNFALDGLLGFDLNGKTAGVIGTGKIGAIVAQILQGFGCRVLVQDCYQNPEVAARGAQYVELPELFSQSDIVTLHCPLTPETRHVIDADALEQMKPGVMLINTGRGALIDTPAVVGALKTGRVGYLGLDVYEEESALFFEDRSGTVIQDDVFMRLLTFPNVVITGHQAFFTREALQNIATTTLANITAFESGVGTLHVVGLE